MFNKIEFSDLYKFITSTGLVIIAFAFFIPWLFLKQDQGLIIAVNDFLLLNEKSKTLLNSKMELNILISESLLFISITLLIVGIIFMIFGVRKWSKKQKLLDEVQLLEVAEKRAKQKPLEKEEILQKADIEINEELNSVDLENKISPQNKELLKSNLINIEEYFYEKLLSLNPSNYRVSNNIKIADKYEVDILLNSYKISNFDDILIDIKYLQNHLSLNFIKQSFLKFKIIFSNYTTSTKRNGKMVFIVVLKSDQFPKERIYLFKNKFKEFTNNEINSRIKFLILEDSKLAQFDINEIII